MNNINLVVNNLGNCEQHSAYGWSNEDYSCYHECFEKINLKDINTLSSVGCGDHILFFLSKADLQNLNHIEISKYSLMMSFLKFCVIKHSTFDLWYKLLYGMISESEILEISQCDEFKFLTKNIKVRKDHVFNALRKTNNESTFYPSNKSFFTNKNLFFLLKERLNNIKTYNLYITSIWDLTLDKIDIKPQLILTSNAYNNPKIVDFDLYSEKYAISTLPEQNLKNSQMICNLNGWIYFLSQKKKVVS